MSKPQTVNFLERRQWARTIFYLVTFVLCAVFLFYVRVHVNHDVTGDEPHYLLMDYSLVHDGDLNLKNNYLDGNYEGFYKAELSSSGQVGREYQRPSPGTQYSIHGIGLPLVLLPGFLIAGATGAEYEMVIIAWITLLLSFFWVRMIVKNSYVSLAVTVLLAISYFYNGLAGYIYPDILVAALTLGSLIILEKFYTEYWFQALYGVLIGLMVLVHFRMLVLAGPLFVLIIYKCWKSNRKLPYATFLTFIPIIAVFFLTLYKWFGVVDPAQIYPPGISLHTLPFSVISAILFDSNRGLLVYNPIMLLIFIGLPIWFKQNKNQLIYTLLAIGPSMVVLAVFNQWQGGYAPIGRYVMDFLPVLMPALGLTIKYAKKLRERAFIALLAVATLAISIINIVIKISYINPGTYRTMPQLFSQIKSLTGISFNHLLPSYSNLTTLDDRRGMLKLGIGYLILGSLLYYGFRLYEERKTSKRPRPERTGAIS